MFSLAKQPVETDHLTYHSFYDNVKIIKQTVSAKYTMRGME
jgi:hypothetical protein